ncbi:MAG: hypothetical protein IKH01_13255 [Prevotella sp.]|nr:hypothetical protein [Prevotella sp.]
MVTINNDELIGSKRGVAKTKGGPNYKKYLTKIFRHFTRKERNLQIINHQGGSINFYLIDEKKENIENLIMEYNNLSKEMMP